MFRDNLRCGFLIIFPLVCPQNWKKTRTQIFFACIVPQMLLGITPGLMFFFDFFPKQFTVGFTLKKKRGVHRLARACSVGSGLGVAWAWLGRAWLGRGVGVAWAWLGRGVGVAWARLGRGRGLGVAWAWLGRGVGVAWAWLGRGVGVAWAWLGRGVVAWAKDLVMLL